jgi:integrase
MQESETNDDVLLIKNFGLYSIEANRSQRRKHTTKGYLDHFRIYIAPYLGDMRIDEIKPMIIKAWQSKLGEKVAPATIRGARTVLMGILNDAVANEIIDRNPFEKVKPPQLNKIGIEPFNAQEVRKIVSAASGWFKNYIRIAFSTGMRTGELLGLKWEDVDFERREIFVQRGIRYGEITLPKNASSIRRIDMVSAAPNVLREQYSLTGANKSRYIFATKADTPHRCGKNICARKWKPLLKKLGFHYRTIYQTRHTFASLMLSRGEDIMWVSRMMGHTDATTTFKRYARYLPKDGIERALFLNDILAG